MIRLPPRSTPTDTLCPEPTRVRSGDARRAVAWKPSARHGALLVREYEQPLGADIVLDWHALHALAWEDRIRRLARWVDEAEREGRRWRLQLPGEPALEIGRAHV